MPFSNPLRNKGLKSQKEQVDKSSSDSIAVQSIPLNLVQRLQANPQAMQSSDLLYLQRMIGNHAVSSLLKSKTPSVQRQTQVGPTEDTFEHEANEIAAHIEPVTHSQKEQVQTDRTSGDSAAMIGPEGGVLHDGLASQIQRAQSGGSSLPNGARSELESKMGADLSPVKIHTDANAAKLNMQLGAKAFTHSNHIFYGKGQSPGDLQLTAHETAHTIQQGAVNQVQTKREQKSSDPSRHVSAHVQTQSIQGSPIVQRFSFTKRGRRKKQIRSAGNWDRKPTSVTASSGGVRGGALFVNFPKDKYVLKSTGDDSPARGMFSEHVFAKVGGVETPDSVPIQKGTPTYDSILKMLDEYENDHRITWFQQPRVYAKFKAGVQNLRNSQYILVMKNLMDKGGEGLGEALDSTDEVKGDFKARDILFNGKILERIGITMAIDFAMGNADRFEEMNLENVFLMANGNLGAIDNDSIFPKLPKPEEVIVQDESSDQRANLRPVEDWVAKVVRGHKYRKGMSRDFPEAGVASSNNRDPQKRLGFQGTPLARIKEVMSDFDTWFTTTFRNKIAVGYNVNLPDEQWERIKNSIHVGLSKGIKRLERSFRGRSGRRMHSKFSKYGTKYQLNDMQERNYDWQALQVRQKFLAMVNQGTDPDVAEHEVYKYALSLFGISLRE